MNDGSLISVVFAAIMLTIGAIQWGLNRINKDMDTADKLRKDFYKIKSECIELQGELSLYKSKITSLIEERNTLAEDNKKLETLNIQLTDDRKKYYKIARYYYKIYESGNPKD